jgi:hypothetical protein
MDWITEQVDTVTIVNSVDISFRATDDEVYDSEFTKCNLMVLNGKCRFYYQDERYGGIGWSPEFWFCSSDFHYINLYDVQKALSSLIEKLETFPTRKESADRLHALAELLN